MLEHLINMLNSEIVLSHVGHEFSFLNTSSVFFLYFFGSFFLEGGREFINDE